jgi:hypothetical protein
MSACVDGDTANRPPLEFCLHYHLRCMREDATDPVLTALDRVTLVRGREERVRGIELESAALKDERRRAGDG